MIIFDELTHASYPSWKLNLKYPIVDHISVWQVVFCITEAKDVDKLFLIMDEMERWIKRGSDVPGYILQDIPKEGKHSTIFIGM